MQYTDEAGLKKAMSLIKGYIDSSTSGLQEAFTVGEGLTMENGVLSVTLDSTLYIVLPSLPSQPAEDNLNKLHLVPSGTQDTDGNNIYTEYLWIEDPDKPGTFKWEKFGEYKMDVDLSGYLMSENLVATVTTSGITVKKNDTVLFAITAESNSLNMSVQDNQLSFALKQILQNSISSGLYKVAIDTYGRVVATTAVTLDDLTALGVAKASEISTNLQNLEKSIDDEKKAREAADTALDGKITSLNGLLESNVHELYGHLATQNEGLSNMIVQERNTRQSQFEGLQTNIGNMGSTFSNEIGKLHTADTALGDRIQKVEDYDSSLAMSSDEATAMYNEIYGNNS